MKDKHKVIGKHIQPTAENGDDANPAKKEETSDLLDWVQCIVLALVLSILVFLFVGRTVSVSGPSMERTFFSGERVLISNLFYTPKQGDVVVFRKDTYKQEALIKRIIALEGQKVDIDFERGLVYVDGVALDEPYVNTPTNLQLDFDGEITVPEGCVFVLGDNRNKSNDSRDDRIGCVDERYILGRVVLRLTPLSRFGGIDG